MSNAPFVIRVPPSGPVAGDMTPGYVLTVQTDGKHVAAAPGGGGGGAVSSVFARVGAVVAQIGDYLSSQVSNNSTVAGASVSAALDALKAVSGVVSVFGRAGTVVAASGDYDASQVTNDSGVAGASVADALDTLASASSPLRTIANGTTTVNAAGTLTIGPFTYNPATEVPLFVCYVPGLGAGDRASFTPDGTAQQNWCFYNDGTLAPGTYLIQFGNDTGGNQDYRWVASAYIF